MRLDDWQNNLSNLIEAKRSEPFDFAKWNCLLWAFAAIEAVNGQDYSEPYKGKFKTEKGAAKLMRKVDGSESSLELLAKRLGDIKPIAFARYGDIVFVDPADTGLDLPSDIELFGVVPGVCYGANSFFVGKSGLVTVETLRLGQALWVS